MTKYVTRQIHVDAFQFKAENNAIANFDEWPQWAKTAFDKSEINCVNGCSGATLQVITLGSNQYAESGAYVFRNAEGVMLTMCKELFLEKYVLKQ